MKAYVTRETMTTVSVFTHELITLPTTAVIGYPNGQVIKISLGQEIT